MKNIIVRKYGLRPPVDWDDVCAEILFKQNRLWNRLVEIDHKNQEIFREIISADSTVRIIEKEMAELREELDELISEQKATRAAAWNRKSGVSLDDKVNKLKTKIKDIAIHLKEARKNRREKVKPKLDRLNHELWENVKCARRGSGLWWGNSEGIIERYKTARSRAIKVGASLKFKRFTGEGQFRVRYTNGGIPANKLFSDKLSQMNIPELDLEAFTHPIPRERRKRQRTTLKFTVGKVDGEWKYLHFPIWIHRSMPKYAMLKTAVVTRKRIGTKFHWHLILTFTEEVEKQTYSKSTLSCGINFGFRLESKGLRVATLVNSEKKKDVLYLPSDILQRFKHVHTLKSDIDTSFNEFLATFKTAVSEVLEESIPEMLAPYLYKLNHGQIRSPSGIIKLTGIWRENQKFRSDLYNKLEKWRKHHKRKYIEATCLDHKTRNHRNTLYRTWAKKLTDQYGVISLDASDYTKMARIYENGIKQTELYDVPRKHRFIACISNLRKSIEDAALRDGVYINHIISKFTKMCSICNNELPIKGHNTMVKCDYCGAIHHIDENAATNINKTA